MILPMVITCLSVEMLLLDHLETLLAKFCLLKG